MKTDHDVEGTEEKRGRRVRAPTSQHRYGQVRTLRGYPLRPPTPDDGGERSEPVCTGSVVALQQPTKAAAQAWSVPATPPRSSHHRKGGQPRRDRRRHHRRHQRLAEQVKGHRNGGRHGQRHAPAEGNVLQHCEGTKRGGGGQCKASAVVVAVERMTRTPRGRLEQQRPATVDTQTEPAATEEPTRCTKKQGDVSKPECTRTSSSGHSEGKTATCHSPRDEQQTKAAAYRAHCTAMRLTPRRVGTLTSAMQSRPTYHSH